MKVRNIFICVMIFLTLGSFSAFAQTKPYSITVNTQQNIVTIYTLDENGSYTIPYKAFYCSAGKNNNTPSGTFNTQEKYIWRSLYGGVSGQYATRITGSILFHSVPYKSQNKSTLLTSYYNKLGQNDSMGCVRLSVADAKWIYDNCPIGTQVRMYRSGDPEPLTPPDPITISLSDPNKGWDPTDPDSNNPWPPIEIEIEEVIEEVIEIIEEVVEEIYTGIVGFGISNEKLSTDFPTMDRKISTSLYGKENKVTVAQVSSSSIN